MATDHRGLAAKHLEIAERTPGLRAFFDGCCEPVNPGGTAGYGAVIFDGNERVWQHSGMIPAAPTTTNNIAEYLAVISIFDWLIARRAPTTPIRVFGDSRLVICQLWGWPDAGKRLWKITGIDRPGPAGFYATKAVEARTKLKGLPGCKGFWIPREMNEIADELSKAEIRRSGVRFAIQPESEETLL